MFSQNCVNYHGLKKNGQNNGPIPKKFQKIMAEIQDEHISTISIGGRNLSNLRFADDIDLIAGSNDEL